MWLLFKTLKFTFYLLFFKTLKEYSSGKFSWSVEFLAPILSSCVQTLCSRPLQPLPPTGMHLPGPVFGLGQLACSPASFHNSSLVLVQWPQPFTQIIPLALTFNSPLFILGTFSSSSRSLCQGCLLRFLHKVYFLAVTLCGSVSLSQFLRCKIPIFNCPCKHNQ